MQSKNSHYFGGLVLSLLAMLILAVLPAAAQQLAEEMTESLSETVLNSEVQSLMSAFNQAETLSSNVNLSEGRVEISGIVEGRAGNKLSFAATIIPSLEDGQLTWLLADAEVMDSSGALVENQNLAGTMKVWRQAFRNVLEAQLQTSGLMLENTMVSNITSVAIDEDGLTITFMLGNENRQREVGTSDLQNAENLIISEQQANDVLSAIAERSDAIESITTDFQVGQIVLEIRGGPNNANGIIAILIGLFSPDTGTVKWEISDIDAAAGVDVSKAIELHLRRFSRFVDLQIGDRPVTDFAITEDAINISVNGEE